MYGRIVLSGSTGEFVTGGRAITLNGPPNFISLAQDGPGDLTITVGETSDWEISLASADKRAFQLRHYAGAQQHLFADPEHPSLSVSGNGHAYNELRGEFQIESIEYDSAQRVVRLGASLRQLCDGSKAILTGSVDLRSTR
jgi:hypothetical protein